MEEARVRIRIEAPGSDELPAEGQPESASRPRAKGDQRKHAKPKPDSPGKHRDPLSRDEVGAVRAFIRGVTGNRSLRPEDGILQSAIDRAKGAPGIRLVSRPIDAARGHRDAVTKAAEMLSDARKAARAGEAGSASKLLAAQRHAGAVRMAGVGGAVALGVGTGLAAADFATKAGAIAEGLGVNLPGPISSTLSDFNAGLAGIEGFGQAIEKSKALSMAMAMTGQKIAGEDVAKFAKGLYWSSVHDAYIKRESSLNRTKMAAEGTLQLGKAIFAESFGIR